MNTDVELEIWREQWQAQTAVPVNLRRSVERQSRLMKIGLLADTVVTVVMGGGATAWAFLSSEPGVGLVAVATWLFLAAAWIFVLTANRGLWAPSALDTAAFVDLSVRRSRSALTTTWFAGGLFLCEVAFGLGWAYKHSVHGHTPLGSWLLFSSLRIDIVWICTIAFFGAMVWYRRKKRAELASLLRLGEEMGSPADRREAQAALPSGWNGWPLGRHARRLRNRKNRQQF